MSLKSATYPTQWQKITNSELVLKGHSYRRSWAKLAISSDGMLMLAVRVLENHGRYLSVWNTETGTVLWHDKNQQAPADNHLTLVSISRNFAIVVAGSKRSTVEIWDAETGNRRADLESSATFDGSILALNDVNQEVSVMWQQSSGDVYLTNLARANLILVTAGRTPNVEDAVISQDRRRVVLSYEDGVMRVVDVATGASSDRCDVLSEGYYRAPQTTANGRQILLLSKRKSSLELWDVDIDTSWTLRREWEDTTNFAISADGQILVLARNAATRLIVVHAPTRAVLQELEAVHYQAHIVAIAVSADGRLILSLSFTGVVRLWKAHKPGTTSQIGSTDDLLSGSTQADSKTKSHGRLYEEQTTVQAPTRQIPEFRSPQNGVRVAAPDQQRKQPEKPLQPLQPLSRHGEPTSRWL